MKKTSARKAAPKKAAAKKAPSKKAPAKKASSKKTPAKKAAPKKVVAKKKPVVKKTVAKKPVKKAAARKPVKKVAPKRPVVKKTAAKKPIARKAMVKKVAAKKPVKRVAAKKPVAKKPVVKKVAPPKPVKKIVAKAPLVKTPPVKAAGKAQLPAELVAEVSRTYRQLVDGASAPSARQQYEKLCATMLENDFTMKGKPFPTFLKPLFVHRSEVELFRNATQLVMSAAEKVANLYFTEPKYKPIFEVDEQDRPLVEIQPAYPNRLINARLDAFLYDDGTLKFLEFNTDSPSGMGWHDRLIGFFGGLPVIKQLQSRVDVRLEPLLHNFHSMLMRKYRQCGGKEAKPTFAIVCAEDSTIRNDVDIIIDTFNRTYDHKSIFAAPEHGEFRGDQFYMNGEPVHLVFRDSISEFTSQLDKCKATLDAFRQNKICFVNPFCSRVGGLKAVLWLLTDDITQHLFTPAEVKAIQAHIPWTRLMKPRTTTFRGKTVDLFDLVSKNKDLFVLKPNSGYGGFNVTIGRETDQSKWDETVNECNRTNWVVQEFIPIPAEEFPVFDPELVWRKKNVNINFFAYDGQYGGGFVRVADTSIINIHQGGGLLPIGYVNG